MRSEAYRRCIEILLDTCSEEDLEEMLQEEGCWSAATKQMIRERLEFLQEKGRCGGMNVKKELQIAKYQPVVGFANTEIGEIFAYWINEYGRTSIFLLCSYVYNLGKVHGKRAERARRKK